jgi:hypothetical protein
MAKQGRKYKQWVVGRYEIPLAAGLWFQPRLVDGSEKPGQETGEREREEGEAGRTWTGPPGEGEGEGEGGRC